MAGPDSAPHSSLESQPVHRAGSDWPFWTIVAAITGAYAALIMAMLLADLTWAAPGKLLAAFDDPNGYIASSIRLSLVTCTVSAILALLVAVPAGYVLSRTSFFGKGLIDALIDIPIVLPPMVIGISLMILFRWPIPFTGTPATVLNDLIPITFTVGAVVLAQFVVGAAFAVRAMRTTFDHLPRRPEDVARVLGCSRAAAFAMVTLPSSTRGMVTAYTLAWARSMGEFGPILVFAGTFRGKTEVMSSTVFIEFSVGNIEAALAVSLLMVVLSIGIMAVVRLVGSGSGGVHDRA